MTRRRGLDPAESEPPGPRSRNGAMTRKASSKQIPARATARHLLSALVVVVAVTWCVFWRAWPAWLDDLGSTPTSSSNTKTLVTYIYAGTDAEYANNFRYFLQEGIRPDDGCDYVLVIQMVDAPEAIPPTEDLSRVGKYDNVRIFEHENSCYDLGTLGWLYAKLEEEGVLDVYAHFVWINSSVRGPFLPPYLDGSRAPGPLPSYHWTRAFTDKVDDHVKLVGSTVSCGGSGPHPPTPHIQSYAVATDAIGLNLLRRNTTVLACYDTMQDVVFYGERGITETILNAGFGIDSLMARYQGMDWQGNRQEIDILGCNADLNPIQPGFYDGTDVDPMEVMFVKVKSAFLEAVPRWPSAARAHQLSLWKEERGDTAAAAHNEIVPRLEALSEQYQRERASKMRCFDWEFYLQANKQDPLVDESIVDRRERAAAAYEQFYTMGVFEGRPHRWMC